MSTILKALRRLEQDRDAEGERPLRERVVVGEETSGRRARWPVVALLALAAGVGTGTLAFWLASGDPAATESAASAQPTVASKERASPRAAAVPVAPPDFAAAHSEPAAEPLRPATGLPSGALASPVKVVKRPLPAPRIDEPMEAAAPEELEPTFRSREAELGALPGRHRQRVAALPEPADEGPRAIEVLREIERPAPAPAKQPAPAPKPVAPVAKAPPAPEPVWEVPQPIPPAPAAAPAEPAPREIARADIPDVRIERTEWHPDGTRRRAVVEIDGDVPQEIHEGDAVGPLVVSRIEPSGVVFLHEGVEIRRRVGQ